MGGYLGDGIGDYSRLIGVTQGDTKTIAPIEGARLGSISPCILSLYNPGGGLTGLGFRV